MVRLNELGVEIPGKMKITGVDDAKYASFLHVPLTTVQAALPRYWRGGGLDDD